MALFGFFPVVFALGGFLLGFVVVAPVAEGLEVVGVVVSAGGEVLFVVDLEGFAGWVLPAAVLAGVVVAVEGGFSLFCGDVFLVLVFPAHSMFIAMGLLCQAMIPPWWVMIAV